MIYRIKYQRYIYNKIQARVTYVALPVPQSNKNQLIKIMFEQRIMSKQHETVNVIYAADLMLTCNLFYLIICIYNHTVYYVQYLYTHQ